MKKFILLTFLVLALQIDTQAQTPSNSRVKVAHPEVPRVSAYEAYLKYKAGNAIIIHAGGESYQRRHILRAFDVNQELVRLGKIKLPKFPRKKIEIFTYCY